MDDNLKPQTILVTGAAGFIGHALLQYLKSFAHLNVYGSYHRTFIDDQLAIPCDLSDAKSVKTLIQQLKPNIIFHLAGKNFSYAWQALFETNILPTQHICQAILETGITTKLVTIGSAAEYGEPVNLPITEIAPCKPLSPYGQIKQWQTQLALFYARQGLNVSIARVFNVLGKRLAPELAMGAFITQLRAICQGLSPPTLHVGTLSIRRDYLSMSSLCAALYAIAREGRAGEIYNVCSGQSIAHAELINGVVATLPTPVEIIYDQQQERNRLPDIYGCNQKLMRDTNWKKTDKLQEELLTTLKEALWA